MNSLSALMIVDVNLTSCLFINININCVRIRLPFHPPPCIENNVFRVQPAICLFNTLNGYKNILKRFLKMSPGALYNLNRVKFAFLTNTLLIELLPNLRFFPPT